MWPAAFCDDVLVGAIAVRLERQPSGKVQLYIITLGVLAAYRKYGVGEHSRSIICLWSFWQPCSTVNEGEGGLLS